MGNSSMRWPFLTEKTGFSTAKANVSVMSITGWAGSISLKATPAGKTISALGDLPRLLRLIAAGVILRAAATAVNSKAPRS